MKRIICSYGKVRPEMAPECPERFDMTFLRYILRYRRSVLPGINARVKEHARGTVVRIKP